MDVAELCVAFDLGVATSPLTPVARGEVGRVSRLATTTGAWAVKEVELFLPTLDEVDANVELQESMLAAGISLPRPRRTLDGHGLFGNVRVYEWLDMTPIVAGAPDEEALVAASLARMHAHAPPTDQAPDAWYLQSPTRDEWLERVHEGRGCWWAAVVAGLVAELADVARPEHSPTQICHLDVCPENVFLCDGRLTVIDWENAGPAATVQDLGSTLWDFCQGDTGRTRRFVTGYQRHGGPIERLDAPVFATARVVQANLIDFHSRRALDPEGTPETRQRAEQGLRACLTRPLTRRLIDEMVAAAT